MIRNLHRVLELIDSRFADYRVLVIGDIMIDRYIRGVVERISPEAPVPILRHVHESEVPGGAANVAMNLSGLGVQTTLAGFCGRDSAYEQLCALLQKQNIGTAAITNCHLPTVTKTRIISGQQQMLRLDVESVNGHTAADYTSLINAALPAIEDADAVILSDYAKGTLPPEVCHELIRAARQNSIPILVDPKGKDFSKYRGATSICPNLNELHLVTGIPASQTDDLMKAGRELLEALDLEYLTVTMSEKGIRVLSREGDLYSPARAREVFDVSGAGDTVIATLAACVAAGLDIESAVHLCNVAAGVVVGKIGTAPITRADLIAHLGHEVSVSSAEKVMRLDQIKAQAALWRTRGDSIVFTNGCYDILHVGHIAVLEGAKRMGARLVVGVNTDASTRRLKGPSRPINGEKERALLLAALSSTDAIVLFDEDTPLNLIRELRPDVLVKGGDYSEATIVGAPEVRSWGGRVEVVPIVSGYSTTSILEKGSARTH